MGQMRKRWTDRKKKMLAAFLLVYALILSSCGSFTPLELEEIRELLPNIRTESAVPERSEMPEQSGEPTENLPETESVTASTQVEEQSEPAASLETVQPSEPAEEAISFLKDGYSYYREQLTEMEQLWYDEIAEALGQMETEKRLSEEGLQAGMNENSIDKIFQCVLNDHPEIFYVQGYNYTKYSRLDRLVALEISGIYTMDQESVLGRQQELDQAMKVLAAALPQEAGDYEKVKYAYETIIRNTEYDLEAPDNQNIYSVFVNHRSVCQGYAKAVQYLLNHLGVSCILVQGTVDTGEGHAWNMVQIDGVHYYVDATWGDASYRIEDAEQEGMDPPEINYDYLCITTDQLLRTHILGSLVPMPVCTSLEANYYVREGAYFTSYDMEQMKQLCQRYQQEGRHEVTVKCSDHTCYLEMRKALVEEQGIFDCMDLAFGSITYAENEKQMSLSFWMTN